MQILCAFFWIFCLSPNAFATEAIPIIVGAPKDGRGLQESPRASNSFALVPLSPVLSQGEMRVEAHGAWERGPDGFFKDSGARSSGLSIEKLSQFVELSFGILERLTLMVGMSHTSFVRRSLDASKYRTSEFFIDDRNLVEGRIIGTLRSQSICATELSCRNLIDDGYALSRDDMISLPGGESLPLRAGIPLKDVIDSAAVGRSFVEDGESGIGDLDIELSSKVYDWQSQGQSDPSSFSLGASLLMDIPTGSFFSTRQSQLPTGYGVPRLGIGIYADFQPERHILLGAFHRIRFATGTSEQRSSSFVDSSNFQGEEKISLVWDGSWQEWCVHFGYDWSDILDSLTGFTTGATWTLQQSPAARQADLVIWDERNSQYLEAMVRYAMDGFFVPLALETAYREPLFGNVSRQMPGLGRFRAQIDIQLLSFDQE